jgi:enoyl-CoA hydratase/carnithine racemase
MSLVEFETNGAVAVITLNRPELRNAVNVALMNELRAALARVEETSTISVAVLTGAGKVFCSGMDLGAFAAGERPGITEPDHFAGFVSARRTKPIIAAVNGPAVAGGFELVLACDLVIAERGAMFGLPEVKRGIVAAGGGAFRLPRRLPPVIANEMLLTGDPISAERALSIGLINGMADGPAVLETALALANRIAENAPMAVRLTLQIARNAAGLGETEAWAENDRVWARIDGSADALEGALAFKEKRLPQWTGR